MAARTATSWDGTAGPRRSARATRPAGRAQPRGGGGGRPSPSPASAGAGRSLRPPQPRRVPGGAAGQRRAAGRVSMHRAGEGLREWRGDSPRAAAAAAGLEPGGLGPRALAAWSGSGRAQPAEPASAEPSAPRPGPAPAPAPAARPGTPPRASGRGRRLAAAGRPRPQPPAPPPAGRAGVLAGVRAPPAGRLPLPAGRAEPGGGRRTSAGRGGLSPRAGRGEEGTESDLGLAACPTPRLVSPPPLLPALPAGVRRAGGPGGEGAGSAKSELCHPLPGPSKPAPLRLPPGKRAPGDLPEGRG